MKERRRKNSFAIERHRLAHSISRRIFIDDIRVVETGDSFLRDQKVLRRKFWLPGTWGAPLGLQITLPSALLDDVKPWLFIPSYDCKAYVYKYLMNRVPMVYPQLPK